MVPGNGVIVKTDSTAASGASATDYRLGGYDTSSVTHPSAFTVTDIEVCPAAIIGRDVGMLYQNSECSHESRSGHQDAQMMTGKTRPSLSCATCRRQRLAAAGGC